MPNTYVDVIKKDAVIHVPFTASDILALQTILLKNLDHKIEIDDVSWETIENLCSRVDQCAKEQNMTEPREISF